MMQWRLSVTVFMIVLVFLFTGCEEEQKTDGIEVPATTAEAVAKVTDGILSTSGKLQVVFYKNMVEKSQLNTPLKTALFVIEPAIEGKTYWSGTKTLVFEPYDKWPVNQQFTGHLDMLALFPTGTDLEPVKFAFVTAGQAVKTIDGELFAERLSQPDKVLLKGRIELAEPTTSAMLQKAVTARYGIPEVDIQFEEIEKGKVFQYQTAIVDRPKKKKLFKLIVDAKALSLVETFKYSKAVYPLKDFTVDDIQPVSGGTKNRVEITFSDELNPAQDKKGFITITNLENFKLSAIGKKLFVDGNFEYGKTYKIELNKGIMSKWGTVSKGTGKSVEFKDIKPELRFLSDGVYMPNTMQRKLYFETVNLRNVHIKITQIFANNLAYFIQDENLKAERNADADIYSSTMRRVGKMVKNQTLEIGEKRNDWLRHEIDLNKLIPRVFKGMYYIELSFRYNDMIYGDITATSSREYRNRRGDDYYEDPYSSGYLYRHAKVSKPILLTDIGLVYKAGAKDAYVWAFDLISGEPVSGATIEFRTFQNQIINSGKTDGNGQLQLPRENELFFIEASKGDQRSLLKTEYNSLNYSTFDVGGTHSGYNSSIRTFAYSDRGVYRPGDSIYVSLLVRDENNTFTQNHPVKLSFYNPRNQKINTIVNRTSRDGFYSFLLSTQMNAPTGTWSANMEVGPERVYFPIKVETVAPFKLKLRHNFEEDKIELGTRQHTFTLGADFLFGAPAAGHQAEVNIDIRPGSTNMKMFPGYYFGNQTMTVNTIDSRRAFDGKLDQSGLAIVRWRMPDLSKQAAPAVAVIRSKVLEKGGRPNTLNSILPIETQSEYIGIHKPSFDYGSAIVGTEIPFKVIAVDNSGKALNNRNLTYKIYRNDRYWWYDYDSRSSYNLRFKSNVNTEIVKTGDILATSRGSLVGFTPEKDGRYLLEVYPVDNDKSVSAIFFDVSYWGTSAGENDDLLSLKLDRNIYSPGDKAIIRFPDPGKARVLFTIEKDKEVLLSRWLNPAKEGRTAQVEFTVTKAMLPNAYAFVSVIQPHEQTENDRPMRMYGVIPVMVEDPATRQQINIDVAKTLESSKPFSVKLQTADKKPTQYTIAIVDEGLLGITGFKTPDAHRAFYAKQRLGVATSDMLDQVIGAFKGDVFKSFSIGGGGEYEMSAEAKSQDDDLFTGKKKRFKPVVMFSGPNMTDGNGFAEETFMMPEYIGAVRVMVLAADGGKYGSAAKTVPVKTDLMVLPNYPRMLAPNDKFTIPVSVFAMQENLGKVSLELQAEGPLNIVGKARQDLSFSKKEEQVVYFDASVGPQVGELKLTVVASYSKGKVQNQTDILVRPLSPRISATSKEKVRKGSSVSMLIPDNGLTGSNLAKLTIMRKPNLNFDNRLNWLIRYPYGCIEQTVSSVFPQLFLKDIFQDKNLPAKKIDKFINAGIAKLRRFQISSGGFLYWPGNSYISDWASNYAGHFLIEARKNGYFVPDAMIDNWYNYTKKYSGKGTVLHRTYAAYLMALYGKADFAAMNRLRENDLKTMTDKEKWFLAAAYHLGGAGETAQKLANSASFSLQKYDLFDSSFGSSLRDQAIFLEMLTTLKRNTKAEEVFDKIVEQIGQDQWYSTQSLGYALMAMGKFIKANEALFQDKDSPVSGTVKIPGKEDIRFAFTDLKHDVILTDFGKNLTIELDNDAGVEYAYASLFWSGIPKTVEQKSEESNLQLEVQWYNEDGMKIDARNLRQGKTFYGHIQVKRIGSSRLRLSELALVQMVPSGWEIENTRLNADSKEGWIRGLNLSQYDYLDIRDDKMMWFFNMGRYESVKNYLIKLNAVTPGTFTLPPTYCEAMYNKDYRAKLAGSSVTVSKP
jgi:uncharacterized protein YfaS (alpha-2-macroglobulin family)